MKLQICLGVTLGKLLLLYKTPSKMKLDLKKGVLLYYRDVEADITYSYRIQTLMDAKISELSPKLVYTHGQAFCGDGIVNRYRCMIQQMGHCKGGTL